MGARTSLNSEIIYSKATNGRNRTRSADHATSLTSQFNSFFVELTSVVKRPDSLTVGVAGPFDPIDIPGDVKTSHAALASNSDSVPVKLVTEHCLKFKFGPKPSEVLTSEHCPGSSKKNASRSDVRSFPGNQIGRAVRVQIFFDSAPACFWFG